jgi:putative endonuclease
MVAFVYILYSSGADKYYAGCTENLEVRLAQHNAGRNISTKSGAPWALVHTERFSSLPEARKRETGIKQKKSRKYIEWLIHSAG